VSFDIFLQSFAGGEAAPGDPVAARRVLDPYLAAPPDGNGYAKVRTDDGEADVYGVGSDSLMINHASGTLIWQVVVDVAEAGGYVILPIGVPACLVREEMTGDLPGELRDGAVVVRSGAELLDAVARA